MKSLTSLLVVVPLVVAFAGCGSSGSGGGGTAGTGTSGTGGGQCNSSSAACSQMGGMGASLICSWQSSDAMDQMCPFSSQGSCTDKGLVGCCVQTKTLGDGCTIETAVCTYSKMAEATSKGACASSKGKWVTKAP